MPTSRPLLSVIVPVLNEERTISTILDRLADVSAHGMSLQVIVVDDGSTDGTPDMLVSRKDDGFLFLRHVTNRGKGAAFRTGLAHATGAITIVQDADLEYDPAEFAKLVQPLLTNEFGAAYGSRYLWPKVGRSWNRFRYGVVAMNWLVRILYCRRMTDVATCYKALPTELYKRLDLQSVRFELCAEVTAKLCRLGVRIKEVPISYHPRSPAEGKKIGWRDAYTFAWTLLLWRFRPVRIGRGKSTWIDENWLGAADAATLAGSTASVVPGQAGTLRP